MSFDKLAYWVAAVAEYIEEEREAIETARERARGGD
jgi:hypothetical protein